MDINNRLCDIDPEDVSDHEHEVEEQGTIAYEVYRSDFKDFNMLYFEIEALLTKDDLQRFEQLVNEEFYDEYMNDYKDM